MCDNLHMATNLAIDDRLIEEARKRGNHRTKKEAVTTALQEYIQRHRQRRILDAFGTIDFDPAYDYKAERRGKTECVDTTSGRSLAQGTELLSGQRRCWLRL